jgi:hypothetical protein
VVRACADILYNRIRTMYRQLLIERERGGERERERKRDRDRERKREREIESV